MPTQKHPPQSAPEVPRAEDRTTEAPTSKPISDALGKALQHQSGRTHADVIQLLAAVRQNEEYASLTPGQVAESLKGPLSRKRVDVKAFEHLFPEKLHNPSLYGPLGKILEEQATVATKNALDEEPPNFIKLLSAHTYYAETCAFIRKPLKQSTSEKFNGLGKQLIHAMENTTGLINPVVIVDPRQSSLVALECADENFIKNIFRRLDWQAAAEGHPPIRPIDFARYLVQESAHYTPKLVHYFLELHNMNFDNTLEVMDVFWEHNYYSLAQREEFLTLFLKRFEKGLTSPERNDLHDRLENFERATLFWDQILELPELNEEIIQEEEKVFVLREGPDSPRRNRYKRRTRKAQAIETHTQHPLIRDEFLAA